MHELLVSHFIQWFIICRHHYSSDTNPLTLGSQSGSCVLSTSTHHSLSPSLPSRTRCFRHILYFPCLTLGISHFSKNLGSFLLKKKKRYLKPIYGCPPWNSQGMLTALGCHCFPSLSADKSYRGKHCLSFVHIHIPTCVCHITGF